MAEIGVFQKYGASATEIELSKIKFLSADDPTQTIDDFPVDVPFVGKTYSYEVWLYFKAKTAPNVMVNNFMVWVTETLPTGVNITANFSTVDTYVTPFNNKSQTGTRVNLPDRDASNKLRVNGLLDSINDVSNFLVLQLEVSPSTVDASVTDFTINYQYDEV